jgi:hypothetical protein
MYRDKILLSYRALEKSHDALTDRIINLGMLGEYAEINDVFEPGDTFQFNMEMFRDSKDENLLLLFRLFDKLEETMNSLANINGITKEELDGLEEEDE